MNTKGIELIRTIAKEGLENDVWGVVDYDCNTIVEYGDTKGADVPAHIFVFRAEGINPITIEPDYTLTDEGGCVYDLYFFENL